MVRTLVDLTQRNECVIAHFGCASVDAIENTLKIFRVFKRESFQCAAFEHYSLHVVEYM